MEWMFYDYSVLISFPMKDHHDPICIGLYHGLPIIFGFRDGYHGMAPMAHGT
jgi:hypothetical protein